MLEAIEDTDGISIRGSLISDLRCADDTALMSRTEDELQQIVNRVAKASDRHGLHLNVGKTKVTAAGRTRTRLTVQFAGV